MIANLCNKPIAIGIKSHKLINIDSIIKTQIFFIFIYVKLKFKQPKYKKHLTYDYNCYANSLSMIHSFID